MNPWEKRFQDEDFVYGEEPNEFIRQHAKMLENQIDIAAFAEGEGRNAVFLASLNHSVTAFDFSESALAKTEKLANKMEVHVKSVLLDLLSGSIEEKQFDAAIMVFGHFQKQDQLNVLNKIVASVKPDGIIMMELYSDEQIEYKTGGPKELNLLYNVLDMLTWCNQFKIIHFFTGEKVRNEGKLHTGLGHVIQFILRK